MTDAIVIVVLLACTCAFARRAFIRIFWVSTFAEIVTIPEVPNWDYAFMRVLIEVSFETGNGIVRQTCSFPRCGRGSTGEGTTPPVSWHSALGMSAPIYYSASDPNKAIFIGGVRASNDGFSRHVDRFTKGYGTDILLVVPIAIGLAIMFF